MDNNEVKIEKLDHNQRHDLKEALRTYEFAVQSLEDGYKFADDSADIKVKYLRKSFDCISSILNKNHEL